jgi:DNA-directed RNA polymerase subunit H
LTKKFSVLDHTLVPEHTLLTEEEVNVVLKKYNITRGQLPKIKTSDPVIKQLQTDHSDVEIRSGQTVIKIDRESRTAGKATSYRLVID